MITQFKGQYEFLDPAYYCLAEFDGVIYNSAEAAFLAAQFDDPYFRSIFRNPALPIWRARELSKKLQKRRDWTPELSLEIYAADHSRQVFPHTEAPRRSLGYG